MQAQVLTRAQAPAGRSACASGGNPYTLPAAGALALGWCLMDLNRPMEAVTAFDQAIKRGSAATKQDAAYGKSLAYLRKDLTREAAVAAAEAPQDRQRQTDLNATILSQRALAAYRDGRFTEAILALNERSRVVPEQNDLMIIRGYAYYKLGRYTDAERVFRAVLRTGSSEDAAAGLNVVQEAIRPSRQF
jgi:tetratricopeptide (TPR) repeat protein